MAKEDLDGFFDAMRNDASLAEKFAQAVGDFARKEGFSVDDQDVYDHVTNEEPSTRPLPDDDGPGMTTMAMGEEGVPIRRRESVTLAIGEEDRRATGGIGEDTMRRDPPALPITTKAVGEEDKKGPRPPRRGVTSGAIGEEDAKVDTPPSPPRRVTTLAVGEESKKRPPSP